MCVRLWACPLRMEFVFPQPYGSPESKAPLAFKTKCSVLLSPWAGGFQVGLRYLLRENSVIVIILLILGQPPGSLCPEYTTTLLFLSCSSFFLVVDLFLQVLAFFIDSCSINSCNFGVNHERRWAQSLSISTFWNSFSLHFWRIISQSIEI